MECGRRLGMGGAGGLWGSSLGVEVSNDHGGSHNGHDCSDLQILLASLIIVVLIKYCQCVILAVDL